MKLGIKVGDVMTRSFISLDPDTSISQCAKKMVKKNVGSLIIEENGAFKGLLTNKVILRAVMEKKDISELSADNIMSKKNPSIKPEKDIYDAIILMNKKKTRHLPVVDNNKIIGMLTFKDILKIEPTLLDTMGDLAEIKEAREKHKATGIKAYKERKALACGTTWIREGQCEDCGEYDVLYSIDGDLLCGECKDKTSK